MKKVLVILLVLILGIGGGVGMYALSLYLENDGSVIQLNNKNESDKQDRPLHIVGDGNYAADGSSRTVSRYIFVGDSRYVGMEPYQMEEDVFICEIGEGYEFLAAHLYDIKSNIIDKNTVVVIGLGVNDFKYNSENYINMINELADEELCTICYMLVNPVDDNIIAYNGYNITNEEIDEFNEKMCASLNEKVMIIDTNTYLKSYGYNTEDGLHYDTDTYRAIYEYIKAFVNNN